MQSATARICARAVLCYKWVAYGFNHLAHFLSFSYLVLQVCQPTHAVVLGKESTNLTSFSGPECLSAELLMASKLCTHFGSISRANKNDILCLHGSNFAVLRCWLLQRCQHPKTTKHPLGESHFRFRPISCLICIHPHSRSHTLCLLRTSHRAVEALISKQDTFVRKTLPPPHSPLP